MMTTPDTSRPDDAARAIREAIPAPDAAASERIAERIAQRADADARSSRSGERPRITPGRVWKPLVAAGVACLALGIAMFAPSGDSSSDGPGLLTLGPDAAAADVLNAAGDAIATSRPWRPLKPGEYHYTRIVEPGPTGRSTSTTESWLAANGSMHRRVTERLTTVPEGELVYVPALRCIDAASARSASGPLLSNVGDVTTLPVGTAAPACWKTMPLSGMLAGTVVGRTVASPPADAPIELPPTYLITVDDRPLRWGTEVFEGTAPQPVPPGIGSSAMTATTGRVEFTPVQLPPDTTWIAVKTGPIVRTDVTTSGATPAPRSTPAMAGSVWSSTFTQPELEQLPTDGDGMLAKLKHESTHVPAGTYEVDDSVAPGATDDVELNAERLQLALALDLLTYAPISPDVRAATFEALGQLRMEGRAATVDREARFADGTKAIAVVFSISPPPQYALAENKDDTLRLLFDPETAAFRETVMELGTDRSVSTFDAPERVTSIPPVD